MKFRRLVGAVKHWRFRDRILDLIHQMVTMSASIDHNSTVEVQRILLHDHQEKEVNKFNRHTKVELHQAMEH